MDGSRPRRYLLSWGGVGRVAVTCTGSFGSVTCTGGFNRRFPMAVLKTSRTWKSSKSLRAHRPWSKIVVLRKPDVDASQSSLEPRQRVVGASEASVPSCSRSPSMHEASPGYARTSWIECDASKQLERGLAASASLPSRRRCRSRCSGPCLGHASRHATRAGTARFGRRRWAVPGVAKDSAC